MGSVVLRRLGLGSVEVVAFLRFVGSLAELVEEVVVVGIADVDDEVVGFAVAVVDAVGFFVVVAFLVFDFTVVVAPLVTLVDCEDCEGMLESVGRFGLGGDLEVGDTFRGMGCVWGCGGAIETDCHIELSLFFFSEFDVAVAPPFTLLLEYLFTANLWVTGPTNRNSSAFGSRV